MIEAASLILRPIIVNRFPFSAAGIYYSTVPVQRSKIDGLQVSPCESYMIYADG